MNPHLWRVSTADHNTTGALEIEILVAATRAIVERKTVAIPPPTIQSLMGMDAARNEPSREQASEGETLTINRRGAVARRVWFVCGTP